MDALYYGLILQGEKVATETEIDMHQQMACTGSYRLKGELEATKRFTGFPIIFMNYISNSIIWHFKLTLCAFLSQDCP